MIKKILKNLLNSLFVILNTPLLLMYYLLLPVSRKDELFSGFSQFYSLFPGQFGNYIRRNFYRFTMAHCGKNVVIGFGTLFSHQNIEIGDNVYIGPQCNIGLCKIGAETLIGSGVHILSGKRQHNFKDKAVPLRNAGGIYEKIEIGENCWLGNCCVVMAAIGSGTVVGAGIKVARDIDSNSIVKQ
jgi:acetyltransferase-like isoleucine patch superfamily enzyme